MEIIRAIGTTVATPAAAGVATTMVGATPMATLAPLLTTRAPAVHSEVADSPVVAAEEGVEVADIPVAGIKITWHILFKK